jgi:hypothetical protein
LLTGIMQPSLPVDVSKLASGVYFFKVELFSKVLPFIIHR